MGAAGRCLAPSPAGPRRLLPPRGGRSRLREQPRSRSRFPSSLQPRAAPLRRREAPAGQRRVGVTWAGRAGSPLARRPPARGNQLLLGRRAGGGLKGAAPLPQHPPAPCSAPGGGRGSSWGKAPGPPSESRRALGPGPLGWAHSEGCGRGPFKEVVQSSRRAAKPRGQAGSRRPAPAALPLAGGPRRSLVIGCRLEATSGKRPAPALKGAAPARREGAAGARQRRAPRGPSGAGPFKRAPRGSPLPSPAASSPSGKCQLTARGACREPRAALQLPACPSAGMGGRGLFPWQPPGRPAPSREEPGGRGEEPAARCDWPSGGQSRLPIGRG